MSFYVGILYSVQEFLKFVKETPVKTTEFVNLFKKFEATSPSLILEIAESSDWIRIDLDSNVNVTNKGNEIIGESNMQEALRVQIKHLIGDIKPSWSYLIHNGRKEAFQYFPPNVKQCFKEAELIDSYNHDVVRWWDMLASIARGKQQDSQLETGRIGEKLSLQYEEKRNGITPAWQSVDSNLAGFDILSIISATDDTPLRIEVKASTIEANKFTFFLSKNEWNVARTTPNYIFHIWTLGKEPKLYILDKSDVESSIPINQGNGIWENVKVEVDIQTLEMKNRKGE